MGTFNYTCSLIIQVLKKNSSIYFLDHLLFRDFFYYLFLYKNKRLVVLDNFKHTLTIFLKSFSYIPRGTWLPWLSRHYLALDGFTIQLELNSQTTRVVDSTSWCDKVRARRAVASFGAPFRET